MLPPIAVPAPAQQRPLPPLHPPLTATPCTLRQAFARVDRDKQKAEVENLKTKYNVTTDDDNDGEKEAKKSKAQ